MEEEIDVGSPCDDEDCEGSYVKYGSHQDKCYCSASSNPPCSWCEKPLECDYCGKEPYL